MTLPGRVMNLVLVSRDLMLSARVTGAARQLGLEFVSASDERSALAAAVHDDCQVVLLDLRLPGLQTATLVEAVRAGNPRAAIVACGPHVHEQRLAEAQACGCDRVLTRGQLDRELETVLQEILPAD